MARHSDDLLERMATEHVSYEVQMMVHTARRGTPGDDAVLGFAVLESYLLHCRNLTEFLGKARNLKPSDVVAADYFDKAWSGSTFPDGFDLTAIHRRLAHLTTDRLTTNTPGGGYDWGGSTGDRARLARQIKKVFGRFRGDLATAHPERNAWFDESWKLLRTAL